MLVIVSVYLATWTPFLIFSVYKSLTRTHLMNQQDDKVSEGAQVNLTLLKSCLADALQDQSCYIQEENVIEVDSFTKIILQSVEMKIISHILGNYSTLVNSMANPVLYALWYPDFRKYVLRIPHWFKISGKNSETSLAMS